MLVVRSGPFFRLPWAVTGRAPQKPQDQEQFMEHSYQAEGYGMRLRPVRLDDAAFIVWLRNLDYVKGNVGDSAANLRTRRPGSGIILSGRAITTSLSRLQAESPWAHMAFTM